MARHKIATRVLRAGLLAATIAAATGAWMSAGDMPRSDGQQKATLVRLTDLGLEQTSQDPVRIVVYATGPARVGVGNADPVPLTDTLRLSSLPAITADVSEANVHIRLLTPGRLRVGGDVSGGRAIHFTATGRHIVVLKGGVGAETITDP
jgi:hypothetical protein